MPIILGVQVVLSKILAIALPVLMVFGLVIASPALAIDRASGEQIFNTYCVGCHVGGGNIVRRGKTLKKKALERNGFGSIEAIAGIVANGKNNMPAYNDRLTDQQIQDVAVYVLEQAEQGWH